MLTLKVKLALITFTIEMEYLINRDEYGKTEKREYRVLKCNCSNFDSAFDMLRNLVTSVF